MAAGPRSTILTVGVELGTQAALAVAYENEFTLCGAASASSALDLLIARRPGLIIVDTQIAEPPVALLRLVTANRGLPVLALYASPDTDMLEIIGSYRIDAVILKPCQAHDVLDRVRKLLFVPRPEHPPLGPSSIPVSQLVSLVAQRFHESLRLSSVAEVLGMSPSRVGSLARRDLGMSVGRFVTAVRIEVAKALLVDGDGSLEAVARQVGFSDASHLSRAFYQRVGCRPGEFRRRRVRV
jgi:AraC-like DNA-binding protein